MVYRFTSLRYAKKEDAAPGWHIAGLVKCLGKTGVLYIITAV
jgi:hypothetical protein